MTYPPSSGTPDPYQPQQPYGQQPTPDPTTPFSPDPYAAPGSGVPRVETTRPRTDNGLPSV